ncbi:MAG TPA: hypothetical protein VG204_04510 [Terriglobia bacterium]|nr:hypothetical protein [Terriglobia bacterium]
MCRHRKLVTLAKTSPVLVGLLLSAVLAEAFLLKQPSRPARIWCQPGRGINLKDHIPGVDKVKNARTLVLALSITSPYCSESAEFYRRVEQERANDVKLVAIFPQFVPLPIARRYLRDEGLHVDEVEQLFLEDMGISGTPTLMLLDDSGTVLDAWLGKLPPREEDEVITAVKRPPEVHTQVDDGPGAKSVVIDPENRWEAVRILRITDAGQDVLPGRYIGPSYLPGRRFLAGDDWFKDLSFTLRNRTSKTIVYLGFDFIFSEDDSSVNAASFFMNLGEVPKITYGAFHPPEDNVPKGTGKPLQFAPGEEMTVSLAGQAEAVSAWIEERVHPLASVKTCALLVGDAYFEDGMRWGAIGGPIWYEYVDKGSPGAWMKSDDFYFPGKLNPMSRVPWKLYPVTPDEDM